MASQGNRLAGVLRRPFQDVLCRPVVLDEIEVGGRKLLEPIPEIADDGNSFQEHFRQHDRRSDVDIHATAIQFSRHGTKEAKITIRRFTQRSAGGLGEHG